VAIKRRNAVANVLRELQVSEVEWLGADRYEA
jgi:hypothetical protein